jgi:hypothetical protein
MLREAIEASKLTAEQEQQQHAAISQQAAALTVNANGNQQQQQQNEDAMEEDPYPSADTAVNTAAVGAGGRFGPGFSTGISGRGRGKAGRAGRAGRARGRGGGPGGYGSNSSGPQWQQFSEGFEGCGESADPTEGPPAAKQRQQVELPPEYDSVGAHAHRGAAEGGTQRGPTAAFMAAATAAGARAQQEQRQSVPPQQHQQRQQQRGQQQRGQQWQPRRPAVSAGSSTTCNIVDEAGSDTDSDSVTGPFAGVWVCGRGCAARGEAGEVRQGRGTTS